MTRCSVSYCGVLYGTQNKPVKEREMRAEWKNEYRISILFMGETIPGEWEPYDEEQFLLDCKVFAKRRMYFEVEWR
jgi:hypothetical protein